MTKSEFFSVLAVSVVLFVAFFCVPKTRTRSDGHTESFVLPAGGSSSVASGGALLAPSGWMHFEENCPVCKAKKEL